MADDPVWKDTQLFGADDGDAAGALSVIDGCTKDLPAGFMMILNSAIVASALPVGNHDFYVDLLETDGTTLVNRYGPIRFWADGFEDPNVAGVQFRGATNEAGDHRSVVVRTEETAGVQVARAAAVQFQVTKE